MINCFRSALNPLKYYWIIKNTGVEGFTGQTETILENTAYLKEKLDELGWPAWISCEQSNTVFFTRPDEEIIEKYYLATDYDDRFGGDLAHVVVMQSVTRDVIDALIEDLQEQQEAETEHPAFTGYSIDLTNHLTISFGKRMNKQKSQC